MKVEKQNNMSNILTNMKHIHKYLEEDYLPNQGIYKQFLSHYEEVKAIRTKRQEFAVAFGCIRNILKRWNRFVAAIKKN